MTKAEIIEAIKAMNVLELSELVSELGEVFGVDPNATMAVAAGPAAGPTAAAEEEKTEFDVVLKEFPADAKIKVIKVVREITGLGLKEAKAVVEEAPKAVKEGVAKEEAEKIKAQFAEVGAVVEIK